VVLAVVVMVLMMDSNQAVLERAIKGTQVEMVSLLQQDKLETLAAEVALEL
jgi:hypothetical protein